MARGPELKETEHDGRNGGQDRADGGNVVQHEPDEAQKDREVQAQEPGDETDEQPRGEAHRRLDAEVLLHLADHLRQAQSVVGLRSQDRAELEGEDGRLGEQERHDQQHHEGVAQEGHDLGRRLPEEADGGAGVDEAQAEDFIEGHAEPFRKGVDPRRVELRQAAAVAGELRLELRHRLRAEQDDAPEERSDEQHGEQQGERRRDAAPLQPEHERHAQHGQKQRQRQRQKYAGAQAQPGHDDDEGGSHQEVAGPRGVGALEIHLRFTLADAGRRARPVPAPIAVLSRSLEPEWNPRTADG